MNSISSCLATVQHIHFYYFPIFSNDKDYLIFFHSQTLCKSSHSYQLLTTIIRYPSYVQMRIIYPQKSKCEKNPNLCYIYIFYNDIYILLLVIMCIVNVMIYKASP